jgi:hypothetical protein
MSSIVNRGATSTVQGRSRGPLRAQCEVLAYGRIGDYHSLTFVAPEIAERAKPGQFVSLGVGSGGVLRRPFSIYQVSQHGPWAGTVEIVFDVIGGGTAWLAAPRNLRDPMPIKPISPATFTATAPTPKCSTNSCPPATRASKSSEATASAWPARHRAAA